MALGNVMQIAIISVDQIGVVPWSLFLWMVWLILHTSYKKCFQMLLRKVKVSDVDQLRIIKIYWTLAFTVITVPFAVQNLSLTLEDIKDNFIYSLNNRLNSWYNEKSVPSIQTKLSYIILTGYYLNNVCEISVEKGFNNIDFIQGEFLTIFFASTFPARSVLYGIAFTTLVNLVRCILEFCKLLICFSSIVNSEYLRRSAYAVLLVHSFIWCLVYLHILPNYFILFTIEQMKQKSDATYISVCSLLNFSLWGYYLMDIYKSPLSFMITNYAYGKKSDIEDILFANASLELEEFDQDDIDLIDLVPASTNQNISNDEVKRTKDNLLALYRTVKCMIRMKRKLKRIREKLKQEENKLPTDQTPHGDLPNERFVKDPGRNGLNL